jgi:hypothetical protein
MARTGDWMQTYSGLRFYPMDPRESEVDIGDIAHALSMLCRYGGHGRQFYSVAEHSVLMARYLEPFGPDVALWALLHDASEAYIADVIRPIKPFLLNYTVLETAVMACIAGRFDLKGKIPDIVHDADNRIIADERRQNLLPIPWDVEPGPALGVVLRFWPPAVAEREFMDMFYALMGRRRKDA